MSYHLSQLGWDDHFAASFRRYDRPDSAPGRVLRADRGICTVLTATGVTRATLGGSVLIEAARDPAALPSAGDWVVLRHWPDRTWWTSVGTQRWRTRRTPAGRCTDVVAGLWMELLASPSLRVGRTGAGSYGRPVAQPFA